VRSHQQYLELKSEIDEAMQRVLHSGRYVLAGEVQAFEQEFAAYLGCSTRSASTAAPTR